MCEGVNKMVGFKTDVSELNFQEFPDKELLEKCVADVRENLDEYPPIKIFGKICHQRRCVGFFSDESIGYKYSGQLSKSKPMTSSLISLLALVNSIFHTEYNGILVNQYKTGEDYISAHSDDEANLDDSGVVAISWGATRKFRIRNKITKKIIGDYALTSGSMLQMKGNFQKEFTHEIPIEKRVKEARISFTFRKHKE